MKNVVSYTIKKNRKSRIGHPKNGIESKVNMADLSSSLFSFRSYKNIGHWTTLSNLIMCLLTFYSSGGVYNDLRMRMRMSFNKLILICILTHSHWPNENELF